MAQNKYSVNLSAASYTLSFYYKGPSVIVPGQDQNYFQATSDWAGNTPTRGINIPQVMYLENTVPTAQGYKSVAYRWFVEPAEPLFQRFTKVFPIFEGTGASALLGLTADRKLYILSAETSGKWQAVVWDNTAGTPPAWDTPDQVSTATVVGACLICIQGVGIFQVNFITGTLKYVIPTGIDGSLINGICSASGYTIAWDDTTIYWSSTEDPLDFVPSLISGAGSSKVMGLKGNIHLCKEISNGFIIYSDITLIAAAYTANQALPFTFTILAGSSGIRSERAVSSDINAQVHFAWTTGGLVAVELNRATPMFPELTDFIASEMSDDTYGLDKYPQINNYPGYKEVYVVVVSNRYLCISFGTTEDPLANEYVVPKMEQAFVYDLQLKRWGKLNVDHVQIIESPFTAQEPVDFLVSKLYPLCLSPERVQLTNLDYIDIRDPGIYPNDKTSLNLAYTGISLKSAYLTTQAKDNLASTAINFTYLELKLPLKSTKMIAESLAVACNYTTLTVPTGLIRYTTWINNISDECLKLSLNYTNFALT